MPDLIIIRLLPTKPTDGPTFTSYLAGLTITIKDMSIADPQGVKLSVGPTAFYNPADPSSTIVQHEPGGVLAAVATAAIAVYPGMEWPSYPEYLTSDLRLVITRGGLTTVEQSMNFNVAVDTGAAVPPGHDPLLYAALEPVALYLALPEPGVGLDPSLAFVNVPTDGSLPSYDELLAAIQAVYARDPEGVFGIGSPPLTTAQARYIAYEIVWNRTLNPLPVPPLPDTLEDLYTLPIASSFDTDRQQFEGDLAAYYATNNAQAEVLAQYVYAVSMAFVCENKTSAATNAGFELPVLPGIVDPSGKTTETSVILSGPGGGPLSPSFTVSAQYFYALTASLPIQISAAIRYQTVATADSKQVVDNLHAGG